MTRSGMRRIGGGRASLPRTLMLFPGKTYYLCKLRVICEKTSNNKLILQSNYLDLSLNPSLLKMSVRKYHSPILKAFSKLTLMLAI